MRITDLSKIVDYSEGIQRGKNFLLCKEIGYITPWNTFSDDYKMIKSELTIVSGLTGHGKSEMVTHMGLHSISQGAKVFMPSFELSIGELNSRIATQVSGCSPISDENYDAIGLHYRNKLHHYDEVGKPDIDNLFECSQWLVKEWGFDVFIFDNLMMMTEKEDDYNEQKAIVKRLVKFTKDNNVVTLLVAHSKKPQQKRVIGANERGYFLPDVSDIKGCSSIGQLVDNHISVTINQEKLIAKQKHREGKMLSEFDLNAMRQGCSWIKRDKKRGNGNFFTKSLHYDERFHRLKDFESEKCKPYIDYKKLYNENTKPEVFV